MIPTTRRAFLSGGALAGFAALLPAPALAQGKAHIVVLGGGFAGATCARALRRANPRFDVTLVEPNAIFTACPIGSTSVRSSFAPRWPPAC